jgi:ankyrin repeat protein
VEFFFHQVGGVDDIKDTILLYGAMLGRVDIVQAMINRGADPRIGRDRALARAAMAGHVDVAKLLISSCDIKTQRSKELLEMAQNGGCDVVSTDGQSVKTSQVYKAELQQVVDA